MGKYISNGMALVNGLRKKVICCFLNKSCKIGSLFRLFWGTELILYHKANAIIGKKVKIERNSTIVCVNKAKLEIGDNVGIGAGSRIVCRENIRIGENTMFGPNVMLYDHDHKFDSDNDISRTEFNLSAITIGKNCWVGAGTIILKGTQIGDRCIIGAGSVIKGKIASGKKVIQKRNTIII